MPQIYNPIADFVSEQQEYCHAVLAFAALNGSTHVYAPLVKANGTRGLPPVVRDDLTGLRDYGEGSARLQAPDFIGDTRAAMLDFMCDTADILKYRMQPFAQLGLTATEHSTFLDFPHSLNESRRYLALCAHKVRLATGYHTLVEPEQIAAEANHEIQFDARRPADGPQHAPELFQPRGFAPRRLGYGQR